MNSHAPAMAPLSLGQRALLVAATVVAVALQTSFFSHFAWQAVVPNLCLLLVVGASLVRGPNFGMVLGFAAGLLLDLAPPADHVAGRWALALVVVGYVAGRLRVDRRVSSSTTFAVVAACSFIGTSVFALSGLVLGDVAFAVPQLLSVVAIGLVLDVVFAILVVPLASRIVAPAGADSGTGLGTGPGAGVGVR